MAKPSTAPERISERDFLDRYGEVITGRDLFRALGYSSTKSLRRAHQDGLLPGFVFELPNRRGRYALTRDVARWLNERRQVLALGSGDDASTD